MYDQTIGAGHTITDRDSLDLPVDKKVFTGSVVIFESETIQEVEKFIETDMFYRDEIVCLLLDAHHFNNVLNDFRNCLISGIRRRLFFCHSGSIRL